MSNKDIIFQIVVNASLWISEDFHWVYLYFSQMDLYFVSYFRCFGLEITLLNDLKMILHCLCIKEPKKHSKQLKHTYCSIESRPGQENQIRIFSYFWACDTARNSRKASRPLPLEVPALQDPPRYSS